MLGLFGNLWASLTGGSAGYTDEQLASYSQAAKARRKERSTLEWVVMSIMLVSMLWFLVKTATAEPPQLTEEQVAELINAENAENEGSGSEDDDGDDSSPTSLAEKKDA